MHKVSYVSFIVLSLVLILWGSSGNINFHYKDILLGVGGALFGASLSMLVSSIEKEGTAQLNLSRILDFLQKKELSLSDLEKIENLKGTWYQYNKTKKNGEAYWISVKYYIEKSINGSVSFTVKYDDKAGSKVPYEYEGIIRGSSVVFFGIDENKYQNYFIEVWQNMLDPASEFSFGYCFNKNWDGSNAITSCLISRKILVPVSKISTKECQEKLDDLWVEKLKSTQYDTFVGFSKGENSV